MQVSLVCTHDERNTQASKQTNKQTHNSCCTLACCWTHTRKHNYKPLAWWEGASAPSWLQLWRCFAAVSCCHRWSHLLSATRASPRRCSPPKCWSRLRENRDATKWWRWWWWYGYEERKLHYWTLFHATLKTPQKWWWGCGGGGGARALTYCAVNVLH